MLTYNMFLSRLLDESVEEAKRRYEGKLEPCFLNGALSGLNACREKIPPELSKLWERSRVLQRSARSTNLARFFWVTCFAAEVDWVCNVVSVVLHQQGLPFIVPWTHEGILTAARLSSDQQEAN